MNKADDTEKPDLITNASDHDETVCLRLKWCSRYYPTLIAKRDNATDDYINYGQLT